MTWRVIGLITVNISENSPPFAKVFVDVNLWPVGGGDQKNMKSENFVKLSL
jgi:hypothetical protein